ncbi:MAG: DUF4236 domain-containing protein [Erysipelotrichaceae bacterium]|nr:DUF4236 domain-containing protein [Erysipelotrichaceae bacterium]
MGLRFRKSVKICKGVRVNFSKSGASLSMGVKGARYTIGPKGTRRTVGIPGTGIYYTSSSSWGSGKKKSNKPSSYKPASKNAVVSSQDGKTTYTFTPEHVRVFKEYIDKITNFHKKCNDCVDWMYIENLEPPFVEGTVGPKQKEAETAYLNAKPTLLEKFNKSAFENRKQNLFELIQTGAAEDSDALEAWKNNVKVAKGVMSGDINSYYEAIEAADPFVDLSEYGTDIEFGTDNPRYVEVEFSCDPEEIIPIDTISLTSTGKVSHSNYSKTDYYALCQDFVCSYAIRIARELFALLPVENVIVHAIEKKIQGVNTRVILSVSFEKSVFDSLDFSKNIDASDFVETCIHNMDFKKTQGFKTVDKLDTGVIDLKINPNNTNSVREKKLKNEKVNVELPWGWLSENDEVIDLLEKDYWEKRNTYYSSSKTVDEKINNLKNLIASFLKMKADFESKGVYFEKYFNDHFYTNAGKKYDPVKLWKKELEELEDGYLDAKEAEEIRSKALPTLQNDVLQIIKDNDGILQKELVKRFHPCLKNDVLNVLWELTKDGVITKEKSGNSNILKIQ